MVVHGSTKTYCSLRKTTSTYSLKRYNFDKINMNEGQHSGFVWIWPMLQSICPPTHFEKPRCSKRKQNIDEIVLHGLYAATSLAKTHAFDGRRVGI